MTWSARKKNIEMLKKESGAFVFAPGARTSCALLYPNVYGVGMSNLGFHIIYRQMNQRGDIACERFFLPAREDGGREPPLSMETQRKLADFPVIGIMLSFELDYFNLLTMLEDSGIPPAAAERGDQAPLLFAGGPCATFNPEPLAEIVDAFVIGEGEEVVEAVVASWLLSRDWPDRLDRLKALAQIPGVYVPAFYQPVYDGSGKLISMRHEPSAPAKIRRQWVRDIDRYAGHYQIITSLTEFANMFVIEVARGCGRHCRFCMAGYCFRRPRSRDLELVWRAITERPAGAVKVGLLGAAVCDYPYIQELTGRLVRAAIPFSIASLRADAFDAALARALAASGQKTLTIA
ncbi:MAG: B12-binding domain-containing radical SAM protein, partial [Acidaminococcales bacterium]|nr:B12-binding domain-containing radical SAM protein [Acidaminococcales bacterium]